MADELIMEIKKLNKLLILLLVKDFAQNDKIKFLSEAGLQPKEIGEVLNLSPNLVRVALSRMRKK